VWLQPSGKTDEERFPVSSQMPMFIPDPEDDEPEVDDVKTKKDKKEENTEAEEDDPDPETTSGVISTDWWV